MREPIVCFPQIDAGRQVPSKNCESGIFASVALWQWNLSCRVLAVKLALRDCFWTHPILRNSGTLDLDVGTGRRLPGRAHSLVRDGGGAPAVIDRRGTAAERVQTRYQRKPTTLLARADEVIE